MGIPRKKSEQLYTFLVYCSFNIQFTFRESEVELDGDGDLENDYCPTDLALIALQKEIEECLGNFSISSVEVSAAFDQLLGISEEELLSAKPRKNKNPRKNKKQAD